MLPTIQTYPLSAPSPQKHAHSYKHSRSLYERPNYTEGSTVYGDSTTGGQSLWSWNCECISKRNTWILSLFSNFYQLLVLLSKIRQLICIDADRTQWIFQRCISLFNIEPSFVNSLLNRLNCANSK